MSTLTEQSPLAQLARMHDMSELDLHRFLKLVCALSPEDSALFLWKWQHRDKCLERENTGTLSSEDRAFLDDTSVLYDATRSDDERIDARERLEERWRDATTGRKGLSLIRGGRGGSVHD